MRYIFLTFCLLTTPLIASAQSYTVTPPVIEHKVKPRDILEDTIKITNTGTVPVKIFPSVHPITLGEDGSIKTFESPVMTDQTTNVTSWIAVSRARVELQPGESVKIPVTLTINPNAVQGDYYAFVGFGNGDKRDEAEAAVMSGRAPGVTMRISMADVRSEYMRLNNFIIDRYVTSGETIPVSYELENIGDLPIKPQGEIIVYDVRGREVASIAVNNEGKVLAAGERAPFRGEVPRSGMYGRHKAFLDVEYGTLQRANLYDTTFFTVVPLQTILIIFAMVMGGSILLTLLYIYKNRHHHEPGDNESLPVYVRDGVHTDLKDHDINLKKN
ncbi:MAG: hypothetical protein RLZZ360_82 [Candidatus Parcubacteria bacterium]|jgi:hypothetical protein